MQPSPYWTWRSTGALVCARCLPRNGLSHVARLIDEYAIESLDVRVLTEACEFGAAPSDLEFLLSRTSPDWKIVVKAAAKGGHLHVFLWMIDRQDGRGLWKTNIFYAMKGAARWGHLEIIKWLYERDRGSINGYTLMKTIRHGHLPVVKWLLQEGVQLTANACPSLRQATQNRHLATVQWIYENVKNVDTSHAMAGAARNGDLGMLQWLHQQKNCSEACSVFVVDEAIRGGHIRVVEWLFENCNEGCSTFGVQGAARAGNLPMLQWLDKHYSDRFDSVVLDIAAMEGHLEAVKWLHEHRPEGYTSRAMNGAASNGHFEVVRWLHDNRSEGCTTGAMDYAAREGHLHIVNWLHENRSEGCTDVAASDAARNGHLDVLRWLVEHYPDKCRDGLMEIACWEGHLDVVRYLDDNKKQSASGWGLGTAACQGWLKTLLVLVQNSHRNPEVGEASWGRIYALGTAFDETLTRLSSQHATPDSSLWAEALEALELFHSHGYYSCVSRMLKRALERGYLSLVEQFMGRRDGNQKRKYVEVAADQRNLVVLRWLLANGTTPIEKSFAIQLATKYVEVARYLSEDDRVQLVCEATTKVNLRKLLRWALKNTVFNDDSSRATIRSAIKRARNDTDQWLNENLTNAEARKWCLAFYKRQKVN